MDKLAVSREKEIGLALMSPLKLTCWFVLSLTRELCESFDLSALLCEGVLLDCRSVLKLWASPIVFGVLTSAA